MSDTLRVRIFNVGEGDAIAGILPGGRRAFVVDVFKADPILDFLESEGVSEVILFVSHSDRDHILGVIDFLADFKPPRSILGVIFNMDRLGSVATDLYKRTCRAIAEATKRLSRGDSEKVNHEFNLNLNSYSPFLDLIDHPVRIRVLHPAREDQLRLIGVDTNEASGVLLVEHQLPDGVVRKIMLAADVQLTAVSLMMNRAEIGSLSADVLKFPHHGAWPTKMPAARAVGVERRDIDDLLAAVTPRVVVVSVGFDNPHGHVRGEVFDALNRYHATTGRLEAIKCTQFTPTCLGHSDLPISGELASPHCAGDIEIRTGAGIGHDGIEVVTLPISHPDRVAAVDKVGIAQCGFLPEIRARIVGSTHGSSLHD
ncbi:MAG: ComEC/Rec2 family competence protein [Isosphaeraceae bacterium]